MPTAVVLCNNIFDQNSTKWMRGEQFQAPQSFCDMVLDGDEDAGRAPRIAVVQTKRGRPPKVTHETE